MTSIIQQQFRVRNGNSDLIESVYAIIQSRSGKVTSKDLDELIGNKQDVRFAITRLTVQGRIKRIRGFGRVGIEYYYKDLCSAQPERQRITI